MLFVANNSLDPAYNLATEEYLLKQKQMPAIMLWQNDRAIIVGKNQNTMAEINYHYVKKNGITVCRRLTGGGAVFHDRGNLNYTVISDNTGKLGDYAYFSKDLTDFLKTLGLNAEISGRNDVLLDNKKICGNAQTTYKNLVLHHGCILFSADLSSLANALKVDPEKIADKGIKSVKSRVVNIQSLLYKKIDIDEFRKLFADFIIKRHALTVYEFTDREKDIIKTLREQKYNTYNWNYGNSPQYTYKNRKRYTFGTVELYLDVKDGIIDKCKIKGDFFGAKEITDFEKLFIGKKYDLQDIETVLSAADTNKYIANAEKDDIIKLFFE